MKKTAVSFVLFATILPASAVAEGDRTFRWEGEEIFWSVEVSGTEAARASLRAGKRKKARGATYVPVQAKAITHGFFAKSYPVNDNANTYLNPHNLAPIKADKDIREDGKNRTYKVRYDSGSYTAKVEKTWNGKKRNFTRPIPTGTFDALSWTYHLRSMPLKNGDKYTHFVYDGWKLSKLHVTVVGREKIWTPMGYYDSIKVDVEREIMNARWKNRKKPSEGMDLSTREKKYYFTTVHLSDDEHRIPVRLFLSGKLGDSDFRLIKYKAPIGARKR